MSAAASENRSRAAGTLETEACLTGLKAKGRGSEEWEQRAL